MHRVRLLAALLAVAGASWLLPSPAAAATTYTLSVGRSNPGTVTATPDGVDRALNCGSACSAKYNAGTAVTLTATPPLGKGFVGWSGACTGTAAQCTVTMTGNLSTTAAFTK